MPSALNILDILEDNLGIRVTYEEGFISDMLRGVTAEVAGVVGMLGIPDSPIASVHVLLLAAGVVIFAGVAGEVFFRKTGIPDVMFLMILGVVLGPVLGIVQATAVLEILPYFAALALIIIMFDGGMSLNIKRVVSTAHFATALVVGGFVVSVALVGRRGALLA